MAKKVLTIETGAWWTKVALTDPYKKSAQIYDLFYFRTPDKAVEDGYVRDRDRFLTALKEELAAHKITETDVIFIINSTKVIVREVSIPFVKDKQLPAIVDTQAPEYFPMDISSYTITYRKMDETTDENGKKMLKLLLIAVPDNILSNYLSLAEAGGFDIESFEYIGNSALSFATAHFTGNCILVQLEENETIISILVNKKLVFQRVAPNGYGSTLDVVLSHPILRVEDEVSAYYFLTTHNVLYKKPMLSSNETEEDQRKQAALDDAYNDIRDALSYHIRVVFTALEYYRNQIKQDFHGVLRLVGDGAQIMGLKKLFGDEINMEVSEADTISMVHLAKTISRDEAAEVDFTSVMGAAIAPLNVKPKELTAKENKKNTLRVAYIAFAGSILISAGLIATGVLKYYGAVTEQARLQRRLRELEYIQKIYDENEMIKEKEAQYVDFDNMTKSDNERYLDLIHALEEQLPDTVLVQSISASENSISFSVTSPDKLTTAQMLLNFYDIPFMGNVRIPSITMTTDAVGNTIWSYSVVATYVTPPETEEE